jgi:hypothetical protein
VKDQSIHAMTLTRHKSIVKIMDLKCAATTGALPQLVTAVIDHMENLIGGKTESDLNLCKRKEHIFDVQYYAAAGLIFE